MIDDLIITNLEKIVSENEYFHECEHESYEYYEANFINGHEGNKSHISFYKIPPLKSAYPYHYHAKNEETFYIIKGSGILKTKEGEKTVTAGDIIFFPPNEKGAHKIFNPSSTEDLIYLDFDVVNTPEVCFYPDLRKVGIYGDGISMIYNEKDQVDYYDGE